MAKFNVTLPSEVCARIAQYSLPAELLSLSRTSKIMQQAAERIMYYDLILRDPNTAHAVCMAISASDSIRGTYVHRFCFFDARRTRPSALPPPFWAGIQNALIKMSNLEDLVIYDPTARNTWILEEPSRFRFKLKSASLRLQWDHLMVGFLQTQSELRSLHTGDSLNDEPALPIATAKLPHLEKYEGPLLVGWELLGCPLTHIHISIDEGTAGLIPAFIKTMVHTNMPLRNLSIVYIPEILLEESLDILTSTLMCRQLRRLSVICLPVLKRHEIHCSLMKLTMLEVLEVEVSSWDPQPMEPFQRILAMELHTYCPSLRMVVFWIGQHKFVWICNNDTWTRHRGHISNDSL
ncbi:hypothetical protein C8Q75DRAFT_736824 [Abortiporus biennis]|nr:hypothetical protein C8Q75DRAFT_736824 [Abortiporus biennis]